PAPSPSPPAPRTSAAWTPPPATRTSGPSHKPRAREYGASMVRIIRVPYLLAYPQDEYAAQVLLPNIIFVRRGEILTPTMVAHELAHIDQLARYGLIGYWARYVWW